MSSKEDDGVYWGGGDDDDDLPEDSTITASDIGLGWVSELRPLARNPTAWILAMLLGGSVTYDQMRNRLEGDETAVEILQEAIIEDYIFETILLPAAESIWDAGIAMLTAILTIFFGGDRALGIEEGTAIGVLDLPYLLVQPIGGVFGSLGDSGAEFIGGLNSGLLEAVAPLGLFAPVVVTLFWSVMAAVLAWAAWVVLNALDPGIIVSAGKAITRPLRNALRRFT